MGKKIDIAVLKPVAGTLYPPPFDEPCRLRERTRLGDAAAARSPVGNSRYLPRLGELWQRRISDDRSRRRHDPRPLALCDRRGTIAPVTEAEHRDTFTPWIYAPSAS